VTCAVLVAPLRVTDPAAQQKLALDERAAARAKALVETMEKVGAIAQWPER
jgi:hypothetical protein